MQSSSFISPLHLWYMFFIPFSTVLQTLFDSSYQKNAMNISHYVLELTGAHKGNPDQHHYYFHIKKQ